MKALVPWHSAPQFTYGIYNSLLIYVWEKDYWYLGKTTLLHPELYTNSTQLTTPDKPWVKLLCAKENTLHVNHLNNRHPAISIGSFHSLQRKIRWILHIFLVCPLKVNCWMQCRRDTTREEVNLRLFFYLCKSQTYPSRLACSKMFQLIFNQLLTDQCHFSIASRELSVIYF